MINLDDKPTKAQYRSLLSLPKTHLHLHLDGSYPLEAVLRLVQKYRRRLILPETFTDVWHFFDAYNEIPKLVNSLEDLAELCRSLVAEEAKNSVWYMEPAIEPQIYSPRLGSFEQITQTMLQAFAEAAADHGVECGALLTVNTDSDFEIADEIAGIAVKYAGRGVNGFGTAGFFEPGELGRFRSAAQRVKAVGLPVVAHAGQTGGADCVEAAIDILGATRIGHGFRAIESEWTVERLAKNQIVCDICPRSNERLGIVTDLTLHPAPKLLRAGVPVTLNADDSLWFDEGVTEQYQIARDVWGMTDKEITQFARSGCLATGMSRSTRQRLTNGIDLWLQQDNQ